MSPPKNLPCDEADPVSGQPTGTHLLFDISSARLTETQKKKDIGDFHKKWVEEGANDFIAIDGFASTDGPCLFNWGLSCERANAARAELIRLGVPAKKIITFAHGETTAFSEREFIPNRRAVLSTIRLPPPAPPEESVPNVQQVQTQKPGKVPDKKPEVTPQTVSSQPMTIQKPEDRLFSVTYQFNLTNSWALREQEPPPPPSPFLCEHGIFQLGGKLNLGVLTNPAHSPS